MSGRWIGKAPGFRKNGEGNQKTPEKMAMAIPRLAIFLLGNFRDPRAPKRQCPSQKLRASRRDRAHAALLPRRCREKDVRQFLHMRSLHSYKLHLRLIRLIQSIEFIGAKYVALLGRAWPPVSCAAAQECPAGICLTVSQLRTCTRPG